MRQGCGGHSFLKKAVIICIISLAVFSLHFMSLQLIRVAAPSNTTIRDSNETAAASAAVPFDGRDTTLFPANPRIYFIHVGKTGGITLQTIFRTIPKSATIRCRMNNIRTPYDGKEEKVGVVDDSNNNLCYQSQANESQLSRHVLTHFHMQNPGAPNRTADENQWILNHTNMFLFSVRDPINRMISMYNYHRNMNYEILARQGGKVRVRPNSVFFFKQCFDEENGLDEVLNTLKNQSAKELTDKCKRIGLEVLLGRIKGGAHFKLGYRYYKKFTIDAYPTTHAVAVIRMEHMFDDLSQLDRAVGGTGTLQEARYTHGSERYYFPYVSYLSPPNTFTLCCLIYEELEAYQTIILKAINLDDIQKRRTLSNLMNHCQIQSGGEKEDEQDSFSWHTFRHSSRCNSSLSSMVDIIDDVEGKKIVYN